MGLVFLLLMPVALVLIMTLLQDSTFKALENEKIDLVLVDYDHDILGKALLLALDSAQIFDVHTIENADSNSIAIAKSLVNRGEYKIGLIVPAFATKKIRKTISNEIKKQLSNTTFQKSQTFKSSEIEVFFDPIIKASFRQAVAGSIREIIANIQTQLVFKAYTKSIERITGKKNIDNFPLNSIRLKEQTTGLFSKTKIPNSTEHNVPAWTVFAIFFIVIPLSGQLISEQNEGCLKRLHTFPTPHIFHLLGKVIIYTCVSLIQVFLLLVIGHFFLPLLGLPILDLSQLIPILGFTLFVGIAATSYGVVIGTIAKTQHQAAIFGSVSVVILAAIGGVWIPIYLMNETMQTISTISPLKWALSGYYLLILQDANWVQLLPNILKLLGFSLLSLFVAHYYFNKKNQY